MGRQTPVNGAPTFVLTHTPPADYPRGPSNLTFVSDVSDGPFATRLRYRVTDRPAPRP